MLSLYTPLGSDASKKPRRPLVFNSDWNANHVPFCFETKPRLFLFHVATLCPLAYITCVRPPGVKCGARESAAAWHPKQKGPVGQLGWQSTRYLTRFQREADEVALANESTALA